MIYDLGFRKKERFRRAMYSIPSILLIAFIAFILAKGSVKIVVKEQGTRERVESLQDEVMAMALREEKLKKNIARLQTPDGLEEEIKQKFDVVREGEEVAIIVNDKRKATSTNESELRWYEKFWNAIMR